MLKWLVQRVPLESSSSDKKSRSPNLADLITDDPLAVLDLERAKKEARAEDGQVIPGFYK